MCGIVLAGGSLSVSDVSIFNDLLYMDVIRGVHATGVYLKHLNGDVKYYKEATPAAAFLASTGYSALTKGTGTYVTAPVFMVGHNRHATRGNSSDPKNAHPFQHGNITLVHNGTLDDQALLPDSNKFVVDSENICYSIDKIGAAETIQKLDGAFTLIWHDATDDTLHIIRNSERPFHLARVGSDWFGASEEDMLMWILKRNKSTKNRIAEHFECEVGTEYIFDVSGPTKRMVLKDKVEHKLPVFTPTWGKGYGNYYRSNYSSATTGQTTGRDTAAQRAREEQNAIAIAEGISPRIDHRIDMVPHSFYAYPSAPDRGRITGHVWEATKQKYYEVDVHNVERAMYETCMDNVNYKITGIVNGINKIKDLVRLIIKTPSIKTPIESSTSTALSVIDQDLTELNDDIPFGEPDSITMPNGMTMTRAMWNRHDHNKCGGCNLEIPWEDAGKSKFALSCYWHEDCLEEYETLSAEESDIFQCSICSKEKNMKDLHDEISSIRGEDICNACASEIIAKRSDGKEVGYIDKAKPENGVMLATFTEKVFKRMIRAYGSDIAEFSDIEKCGIECRAGTMFAYYFKKGEDHAHKRETFRRETLSLSKTLGNLKITKAYWTQIGVCENCYTAIPWKDVESCSLTAQNRVVCPNCKGE